MERSTAALVLWTLAIAASARIGGAQQAQPYYPPPPSAAQALPDAPPAGSEFQGSPWPAPTQQLAPAGPPAVAAPPAVVAPTFDAPAPATQPDLELFEPGRVIARVAGKIVLEGEIPRIAFLRANAARMPAAQQEEQWGKVKQQLENLIETKLVYADFLRTVPAENLEKIEQNVGDQFEKTYVKKLFEQAGVSTRAELDAKLREGGVSLDSQKRGFIERSIASSWLQQQIKRDEEISHEQMLAYYREHADEFAQPAKARWEQLSVRRAKRFASSDEAYAAMADYGNQILRGANFADVARAHSDAPTASQGGLNDWTTQGSLVSKELDAAIFGLPVMRMSQIIEDGMSLQIVRVVERVEASRTPFVEAQVEIKKKIREESLKRQTEEFLARLRRETQVWTIFDDPSQGLANDRQVNSFFIGSQR